MLLKLRPIKLADMGRCLVVMASFFMLGSLSLSTVALSASAGDTIIVPVHKAKVMTLDRDAGVVLIANPTIADVAVESERLIFLFGLEPGETNILIFDTDGVEIMTAPVVVVPLENRRVTINRASENEEATFSCAPRCAAVATPAGTGSDAQSTGSQAGASAADEEVAAEKEERDAKSDEIDAKNEEIGAENEDIRASAICVEVAWQLG